MRHLLIWLSSASWLVWAYPTDSMAPTIVSRAEEAKEDPSLNDFRRRFDMGITILGDYLYIVGGNISRKVGDNNTVEAINATLSLDMTQDWEPATVELNSFAADVGPPPVWGHGLWADDKGDQVLLWGGSDIAPYDEGARTRKLWVLNPDNSGGGDWDITDAGSGIKRTTRGGYVTCGGKGYLLGGRGNVNTDQEAFEDEEAVTVPGLITYEFDDQVWKNESKSLWTDDGSWLRGQGVCVELPDRSPKVFFLGGQTGLDESKQLDFTTVHYWNPEQDEWFEQETVGKAPEPRLDSCAVGVSGPNGTYDIFMYSGWGGTFDDGSVLDDVWVLSLPAFRWFNISPDRAQARYAHRCVRVGSQMVVIGGGNKRKWWDSVDTFDRGIGILDLNTVSWKTGYEAKSDEYRGPDMIRAWYDEHGYDTAIWSSDEAKKAFSRPDDGTSNPSSTPSPEDGSSSNSSNTAAIAGGTVGGVAGLALVGLAAWLLIRRRRRRRTAVTKDPAHNGYDHGYDHGPVALAEADSTTYNRTPVSMAEADSKVSSSAPAGRVKTTHPKELEGTAGPRAAELP